MEQKLRLIHLYKENHKYRLYAIFSEEGYFRYYQIAQDVVLDLRDLLDLGYTGRFEKIPVFYKNTSIYDL